MKYTGKFNDYFRLLPHKRDKNTYSSTLVNLKVTNRCRQRRKWKHLITYHVTLTSLPAKLCNCSRNCPLSIPCWAAVIPCAVSHRNDPEISRWCFFLGGNAVFITMSIVEKRLRNREIYSYFTLKTAGDIMAPHRLERWWILYLITIMVLITSLLKSTLFWTSIIPCV